MDRHAGKLKEDPLESQAVVQKNQDGDSDFSSSNMRDGNGNPCCKKSKSRISELELEITKLKECISSLSSQLHEAHEKAEDISFIKNESVITLADKLDVVTDMLEEKRTKNVEKMDCKDNLIVYDLVVTETPEEVCAKVKSELTVAEHQVSEISDCIDDIKLTCNLWEDKINNISEERECID